VYRRLGGRTSLPLLARWKGGRKSKEQIPFSVSGLAKGETEVTVCGTQSSMRPSAEGEKSYPIALTTRTAKKNRLSCGHGKGSYRGYPNFQKGRGSMPLL